MALGIGIVPAFYFADSPPVEPCWIPVLFVARHDAALAPDATGHVEMKTVLLARSEGALRDQGSRLHLDLHEGLRDHGKQRAFHQWKCRHVLFPFEYTFPVKAAKAVRARILSDTSRARRRSNG